MKLCILVVLICATSGFAQTPGQDQRNLTQAVNELTKEIESTREEVRALKAEQERIARQKAQAQTAAANRREAKAQGASPKRRAAKLPKNPQEIELRIQQNEELIKTTEVTLAELYEKPPPVSLEGSRKVVAELVIDRNRLREKIRRANNRRTCRWLHIGCIGKK